MTVNQIEESEIPEHYGVFTVTKCYPVAFSAGQDVVVAAGHHPKCRLVSGTVHPHIFTSTGSQFTVEDGDGNDASDNLTTATVDTMLDFTPIAGQVFERNEAICILSVQGNAANANTVHLMFESIH